LLRSLGRRGRSGRVCQTSSVAPCSFRVVDLFT
jgi:hypothetical protein